jgi:hypothetical protein
MAGDQREFLIRITGDAAGLVSASGQAGQAMDNMGKTGGASLQSLGRETEALTLKKEDLKKALHSVGNAFPEVGILARFMFNPITAGAAAAGVGLKALIETLNEVKEIQNRTAEVEGNTAAVQANKKALEEAGLAANAYGRELERIDSRPPTATEQGQAVKNLADTYDGAAQRIEDAKRRLEMKQAESEGRSDQDKQAINDRYDLQAKKRQDEAAARDLAIKFGVLQKEKSDQEKMGKDLEDVRKQQAKTGSEEASRARLETAKKNFEAQAKLVEEMEKATSKSSGDQKGMLGEMWDVAKEYAGNAADIATGGDVKNTTATAEERLPGDRAALEQRRQVYEKAQAEEKKRIDEARALAEKEAQIRADLKASKERTKGLETELPQQAAKTAVEIGARQQVWDIEHPKSDWERNVGPKYPKVPGMPGQPSGFGNLPTGYFPGGMGGLPGGLPGGMGGLPGGLPGGMGGLPGGLPGGMGGLPGGLPGGMGGLPGGMGGLPGGAAPGELLQQVQEAMKAHQKVQEKFGTETVSTIQTAVKKMEEFVGKMGGIKEQVKSLLVP